MLVKRRQLTDEYEKVKINLSEIRDMSKFTADDKELLKLMLKNLPEAPKQECKLGQFYQLYSSANVNTIQVASYNQNKTHITKLVTQWESHYVM